MTFRSILSELESQGNLRNLPQELPEGIIDFSSNDYLGIAGNQEMAREFLNSVKYPSFSSSASRLLSSHQKDYRQLEDLLENLYGQPSLIFNSGYHANTGILPALTNDVKSLIIADKFVHASIIDGIILSRCDYRRFSHNDIGSLKKIIEKYYDDYERIIVITESVFSMDGDEAPLESILELKRKYPKLMLYLDEAHAFGVKGEKGLGLSYKSGTPSDWDIRIFPLGKAAASMGAFVICNEDSKDFLINKSRSLIFSTALPPLQVKWTAFVIEQIVKMDEERSHLTNLSHQLKDILVPYSKEQSPLVSHINPLIIGDSLKTISISNFLFKHGIKALPIRKPTVPSGTERIRFSLSAGMTKNNLENLKEVLDLIFQ